MYFGGTIAFLLASAVMRVKAASFRGASTRELRPANANPGQEQGNGQGRGKFKDVECTLFLKETLLGPETPSGDPMKDLANARSETSWSCEIDDKIFNGSIKGINNNERRNFKRFVDLKGVDREYLDKRAESGNSILRVLSATIDDYEMQIHESTSLVVEEIPTNRRRLAPSTGNLKASVVRVVAAGVQPSKSQVQLRDDVFTDSSCLATQYKSCSKDKTNISEGVIEDIAITTSATALKEQLETAAVAARGKGTDDLVMYCIPPGSSPGTNWVAYAYINSWKSFYNNNWCSYVSVQMHEVGHNLNLAHAGEARDEYDDRTGMMGYSYSVDDQHMCFNAVNNYQLGWYTGQYADVIPSRSMSVRALVLNGVESAGTEGAQAGKLVSVRVPGVSLLDSNIYNSATKVYSTAWMTRDIYIGFNYATTTGINKDSQEYKNRVTITQKNGSPSSYAQSWVLAALSVGQEYTFPNFDGRGEGNTLRIKYVSQINADAFVEVYATLPTPTTSPAPTPICADLTVEVTTDNYPQETSWLVVDASSNVLMSGGGYTSQATLHSVTECLQPGTLTFTVNDSYSDGLCCSYGNGSYAVKDGYGNILAQGASFGAFESTQINHIVGPNVGITPSPTRSPTLQPTASPTKSPTVSPTAAPTIQPTDAPTPAPTSLSTEQPTGAPTPASTSLPTKQPTVAPTPAPTSLPTKQPTVAPTLTPTSLPTKQPTGAPTPTKQPTVAPTPNPTAAPTPNPTPLPVILQTTIFANQNFESNLGVFFRGSKNADRVRYSRDSTFPTARPTGFPGGNAGGTWFIRLRSGAAATSSASTIFTESMSVRNYNSLRLEFDYFMVGYETGESFVVQWKTPTGAWVNENVWVAVDAPDSSQGIWKRASVEFNDWVSAGKPTDIAIRIRSQGTDTTDRVGVDNVIFYGLS